MNYTVWYKSPGLFSRWKKVKGVEGDTIIEDSEGKNLPVRVILLANKGRMEIPMTFLFRFSKERFFDIQKNMETTAGQSIPVKTN